MLTAALAAQPPDPTAYAALCALHPRSSWAMPSMVEGSRRALTPACLAGLTEMDDPTAQRAVDDALADFLFEPGSSSREASDWAVSQAVLRGAELSRRLRDRVSKQLPVAYARRADGYAAFWSLACTDKWGARAFSEDRCRDLHPPTDNSWDRSRVRWRRAGRVSLALLPGAAAVTAGVLTRNDDSGRAVASVTAAAGAGLAAGTLVYYMVMRGTGGDGSLRGVAYAYGLTYATLAALATAIPIGLVSYALLDSSPAARVATTAGGAAALSVCTVLFVWN